MPVVRRLLALLALLAATTGLARDPLRVAVAESWGPPFVLPAEAGGARGGLIVDWFHALEAALGWPIVVEFAPPLRSKRRAREGQTDLRCFFDPAWEVGRPGEQFIELVQPMLVIEERFIGARAAPPVERLEAIAGRRVGTVMGYAYPRLEAAFANGDLRRDDAPAEMNMLEKQLDGRTDYAVARVSTLRYLQGQDARWQRLQASPFIVSSTPLYCGVRRGGPLAIERLAEAQQQMVETGVVAALLAKYGFE